MHKSTIDSLLSSQTDLTIITKLFKSKLENDPKYVEINKNIYHNKKRIDILNIKLSKILKLINTNDKIYQNSIDVNNNLIQKIQNIEDNIKTIQNNQNNFDFIFTYYNYICIICVKEIKSVIVLPCRHLLICTNCYSEIKYNIPKCFICNSVINSFISINL